MKFGEFFNKIRKQQSSPNEAPSHWVKCPKCQSLMYFKEIEHQFNVCPKCGFHMRISALKRIELLADDGSFIEFDQTLAPIDPLKFVDKKSYKKRIQEAQDKTGRNSSVISGSCTIKGIKTQLVVFDFSFMGGSLGSVEGEKIVRAINRAIENKESVVIVSASGGARMQESTFSLLQMSKTSAALTKLSDAGLPFISVLTDPTMGGVSASFAWLGDVILTEPGSLIGFAGQRVIKQTIGAELPEGFQRAEFLLEHGLIDMIVQRNDMKDTIADLLTFFGTNYKKDDFELKNQRVDLSIYALLDFESLQKKSWSIERFISTCKVLHVEMIQYRDKFGSKKRKEKNLRLIKSLCEIPVIINDDCELIEFADGVHVGQEDLKNYSSDKKESVKQIRSLIGEKILGLSTHNKEEILEANELDVDYIGLGAYRITSTKDDATVLKESLSELAGLSLKPVGAIGGVKLDDTIENVKYLVIGSDIYEH